MVGLGGQFGAEIKTNSAQLNLEFWLSLATDNHRGILKKKKNLKFYMSGIAVNVEC